MAEQRHSAAPLLTEADPESKEDTKMATEEGPEAPVATEEQQPQTTSRSPLVLQPSVESTTSAGGTRVNPVTLCVYSLKPDRYCKMTFESGRLTTAQQVLTRTREALGIAEEIEQVFSIWLTSRHLQLQLKSYHLPCKLFKRWKELLSQFTTATYEEIAEDEPILSFQRNAFLTLKEERKLLKKQDSDNYRVAIDLLYHEAVFNITRGRYPLTVEEFHSQAGLQLAVKMMEEDNKAPDNIVLPKGEENAFYPPQMRQKTGGLKIPKLFKRSTSETKTLAEELSKAYQVAMKKCEDPHQLKLLYLQLCWHKPYYGSVFFKGIVDKPPNFLKTIMSINEKHIVVAVNTECIHLMAATPPSDVLLFLTFDQLSWEFQAPDSEGEDFFSSLLLEFDSVVGPDNKKVSKRVQVFSRQAPMMDAMISRCVSVINKQEEEFRRLRLQQGSAEFLEHNIKTFDGANPRVQKQERNHKEHKLQCTVVDSESATPGSRFTLSRVLKTKTRGDVSAVSPPPHGPSEDAALLTSSNIEMSTMPTRDSDSAQDDQVASDM